MRKVRATIVLDIETSFDDDESFGETLLYCINEDLQNSGFILYDSKIIDERFDEV